MTEEARALGIAALARAPSVLRAAVSGLQDPQLDTPYRPGGWTVRQVVHHLVDSHLQAYSRCKLALTEDNPTIRPYAEAEWAKLPDSLGPIAVSLALLDHLHARWTGLLEALPEESFDRTCFHPEAKANLSVDRLVAMYAWHSRHHIAHITELRRRLGWHPA